MIPECRIVAVATHPVIATRRNGLTCYSNREYCDLLSEAEGRICIDEWEFMLHLIAPDMRRLLIPVSDQQDPTFINQTEHELAEVDQKRLQASYFALWQTTDPAQEESLHDEVMLDAVARVAWFLQRRFQGLAKQIVMDYSAQTISLIDCEGYL